MQKKYQKTQGFSEYHLMYCIGSAVYAFTEILFRGFTHWTMVVTGGICCVLIHLENKKLRLGFIPKILVSAITVTALEFAVGYVVNIVLGWNVWDYSDRIFNIMGQICPLFSFFWILISVPAIFLSNLVLKISAEPHKELNRE